MAQARDAELGEWWGGVEATLAPLLALPQEAKLADLLDALCVAGEALCGEALWGRADGRALSAFVEELREAARAEGTLLPARDLPAVLREAMDRVAVRPAWGGHPRLGVYGLIEGRMARADLVIINRFGKLEAMGKGLIQHIVDALDGDVPVIVAVPDYRFDEWLGFSGGMGVKLNCQLDSPRKWWRSLGRADPRAGARESFCGLAK